MLGRLDSCSMRSLWRMWSLGTPWSTAVVYLVDLGKCVELFREIQGSKVQPDRVTLVTVLVLHPWIMALGACLHKKAEAGISLPQWTTGCCFCFGLTNISLPIRVVTNRQICRDCHSAMKLISQAYHREIVIRGWLQIPSVRRRKLHLYRLLVNSDHNLSLCSRNFHSIHTPKMYKICEKTTVLRSIEFSANLEILDPIQRLSFNTPE